MRLFISCALLVATTAGCATNRARISPPDARDAERSLFAITDSVATAVERKDVPQLGRLFADAQYIIGEMLMPPGRYAQIAGPGFAQARDFSFTWHQRDVRILSPDAALVTARGTNVVHTNGGRTLSEDGLYTMVFVRASTGVWRLVSVHKTAIPPAQPPPGEPG